MYTLEIFEILNDSLSSDRSLVHQSTHDSVDSAFLEFSKYIKLNPFNGNNRYYHILDSNGNRCEV